ncbi:centromere protein S isoform X1 [Crotalus tigris]|uniref:centromere protein S isoform X1 n=1 Tax=Crotalus tigris TaxID=88082 RepID=UPI00192F7A1D|nr:centromere protein S isoform X1 [Crotalus tigris]
MRPAAPPLAPPLNDDARGEKKAGNAAAILAAMETEEQRLKAAFHYTVACLCEEVAEDKNIKFSRQTIAAISEITFRQCEIFAKDLEMFAKHGKRSTINVEDVKLLARRSNSLYLQAPADLQKKELLVLLSGLTERASYRNVSHLSRQEKIVASPWEERAPVPQPATREKAPCKNFFWKTFSSC